MPVYLYQGLSMRQAQSTIIHIVSEVTMQALVTLGLSDPLLYSSVAPL